MEEKDPEVRPDLTESSLQGARLGMANLKGANLVAADLSERGGSLIRKPRPRARLELAKLTRVNLRWTSSGELQEEKSGAKIRSKSGVEPASGRQAASTEMKMPAGSRRYKNGHGMPCPYTREEKGTGLQTGHYRCPQLRLVDEAVVDGVKGEFEAVRDAELVENIVKVILNRLLRNEKLFANFLVAETLSDELDDFFFAVAEKRLFAARAGLGRFRERLHHFGGHAIVEPDFARVHAMNTFH